MKIVLLGHDDIASLFALGLLIEQLPSHEFKAFVSGPLAGDAQTSDPLRELARQDAKLCVEFQDHLPQALHEREPLPSPNSEQGRQALRDRSPDLLVSIRYRRILKEGVIAIPKHGVLNLHSGVLPEYQGVMATFWAMLNGEKEIGCTLHRIVDSGIDTGPVIGIARRPVLPSSYLANVLALYPAGVAMMAEAIETLASGKALSVNEQPRGGGNYYSTPSSEDLERFARATHELADGRESAWLQKFYSSLNNGAPP